MTARVVFTNIPPWPDMLPGHVVVSPDAPGHRTSMHLKSTDGPKIGEVVEAHIDDDGQMLVTTDVDDAEVEAMLAEIGDRLVSIDR